VARIRPEGVAVGQIMSQPALAVEAQETAWAALQLLATGGLRHLVVVSGDRCVGVLSDRHVAAAWPFGELSRRTQTMFDLLGDTRPSVTVNTTAARPPARYSTPALTHYPSSTPMTAPSAS